MNKYKEFYFGDEAIKYIKEECLSYGKTLAHCLLKFCHLSDGRVFAYLPPYVNESEAKDFEQGGKTLINADETKFYTAADGSKWMWEPKPTTRESVIPLIRSFLKRYDDSLVVFEDEMEEVGDPPSVVKTRKFIYGKDVYHFLLSIDRDYERVERTFSYSESASSVFVGVMSRGGHLHKLKGNEDSVALQDIENLAQNAEILIIGAYDGEGYLIWEKEQDNQRYV